MKLISPATSNVNPGVALFTPTCILFVFVFFNCKALPAFTLKAISFVALNIDNPVLSTCAVYEAAPWLIIIPEGLLPEAFVIPKP